MKCYTKGKEYKKVEFGCKVSLLVTQITGVIVDAINFNSTQHDSKTLPAVLEQHQRLISIEAKHIFVDRGFRGKKVIGNTNIHTPIPNKNITKSKRRRHKQRAAIEPVIGHLKSDYRLARNFLKGVKGDQNNVMMSAEAMNFKRMINKRKNFLFEFIHRLIYLFRLRSMLSCS